MAPRRASALTLKAAFDLARVKRRSLAKLRGRLDVDRLVRDGLDLGQVTFIADDVYLDPAHPWLITVRDGATLAPGVVVLAHDASMRLQTGYTLIGRVVIGCRVFIGARAVILPGSTVGDDSIVGAGAVVRGDIPPGSVVVGNPASIVTDVGSFARRHLHAIEDSPVWPHEGWTIDGGIAAKERNIQRSILDGRRYGYLRGGEVDAAAATEGARD